MGNYIWSFMMMFIEFSDEHQLRHEHDILYRHSVRSPGIDDETNSSPLKFSQPPIFKVYVSFRVPGICQKPCILLVVSAIVTVAVDVQNPATFGICIMSTGTGCPDFVPCTRPQAPNCLFAPILYMGVSKNRCTPKWMVYNGKPYWSWWFGGTTIFGNIHIHAIPSCTRLCM